MLESLLRHIAACHNAALPGARVRFRLGEHCVGWLLPAFAARVVELGTRRDHGRGVVLDDAAALPALARRLADEGACRWRGEAFDVRAQPEGPVLARIDRGALPAFGIGARGVHVNGLVRGLGGVRLWVARRAADKKLDPGKLDHLVAGGIPAGLTPEQTLIKEAAEEAGLPEILAARARPVGVLDYAMERGEGLRRDRLYCYDLDLPEDFAPVPVDGEVAGFELWPMAQVLERLIETEDFKFNVALVLIDLLLRLGVIEGPPARLLRAALCPPGPIVP